MPRPLRVGGRACLIALFTTVQRTTAPQVVTGPYHFDTLPSVTGGALPTGDRYPLRGLLSCLLAIGLTHMTRANETDLGVSLIGPGTRTVVRAFLFIRLAPLDGIGGSST